MSALVRRKTLIFKVTFFCCMGAILITFLLPNRFTAATSILPPQESKSATSLMMNQLAGTGLGSLASLAGGGMGIKNANDLYIGMLKSRTIQDSLIEKFELQRAYRDRRMSDTRKDLERHTEIVSDKDGIIRIAFNDRDPKRAASIANAYVDELRKLTQDIAVTEAGRRRIFFDHEVQQAKDTLALAEVALKETQQRTGMIQLDSQAKALIETIGSIRGQIAAKEVQLRAMRSFATNQNPDLVILEQQLSGLRAQMRKMEDQQTAGDPILATSRVPGAALEYVRSLREVKYREAVFEALAKQYEAAKLDEAKDAAIIQVLDKAVEPDKKSFPKMWLLVAMIGSAGFVSSILYCIIVIAIDSQLQDPEFAARFQMFRVGLFGARKSGESSRFLHEDKIID
jgi:capsule polysaccharide export protein KpsE/RkpR